MDGRVVQIPSSASQMTDVSHCRLGSALGTTPLSPGGAEEMLGGGKTHLKLHIQFLG